MTWECHVNDYTDSGYETVLGRYIPIVLGSYLKFYENLITGCDRNF